MVNLKHVGKIKNNGSKVLVVFRTLPGESDKCLAVQTDVLPDQYHNAIIELVEKDQAQECFEFGEILFIRHFPDGRPMLQALQADNRLIKISTDRVLMTPNPSAQIPLDQLNVMIAEQKNCSVDDLCNFVKGGPGLGEQSNPADQTNNDSVQNSVEEVKPSDEKTTSSNDPLSDKDLAKSFRSQADAMYKEAARLRRQADELDPPQKKSTSKTTEQVSA